MPGIECPAKVLVAMAASYPPAPELIGETFCLDGAGKEQMPRPFAAYGLRTLVRQGARPVTSTSGPKDAAMIAI